MLGPLTFKLRAFLAKQVSQDLMHSFSGLISPSSTRNHQFWHRAAPLFGIVTGLNQVGEARQLRGDFRRLLTDRMRTQAMIKPRGEGLLSLLHNTLKSFPDGPIMTVPVLGCSFLEESYLSLITQPSPRAQPG